jgi:ATP-dependent Clp protease ATP-binding subunit ClpC
LTKIATEGFDQEFGARPIRRYIQDHVEDMLAQKKLTGEIQRGSNIQVSTNAQGGIVVNATGTPS